MNTLPYGTWTSPITPDAIVAETIRLAAAPPPIGHPGVRGGGSAGSKGARAAQKGDATSWFELERPRHRARRSANETGLSRPYTPFNVRDDARGVTNTAAARTRCPATGTSGSPTSGTAESTRRRADRGAGAPDRGEGPARFADLTGVDPVRRRLLAVRETHHDGAPPANDLVSISTGDGSVRVLASGHDFFAAPAPSPDGRRLAWLAWDQPDMPWDAAALWLAELDRDGVPGAPVRIAGGSGKRGVSARVVARRRPVVRRRSGGMVESPPLARRRAPLHAPGRDPNSASPCGSSGRPRSDSTRAGPWSALGEATARGAWAGSTPNGTMTEIPSAWTSIDSLVVDGSTAAFIGGAPDRSASVVSARPRLRRRRACTARRARFRSTTASCHAPSRSPGPRATQTRSRTATTIRRAMHHAGRRPGNRRRCWS